MNTQEKGKANVMLNKSLQKKNIEKLWGIVGNFIIFAPKN